MRVGSDRQVTHNPIFTKLVTDSDDKLLGMVAYGIYKSAKKEWILQFEADHRRPPNSDELRAYALTWTPQLIQNATDAAASALAEFASEAIDEAQPDILRDALKGNSVRSIGLGIASAFIYTVLLILLVLLLKTAGVDLLSIAGTVG